MTGAWRSWVLGHRGEVADVLARAGAAGADRAHLHHALAQVGTMLDGVAAAGLAAPRFEPLAQEALARAAERVVAGRWHPGDPTTTVLLDWVPRLAGALGPEPAAPLTDLVRAVTRLRSAVDPVRWRDLVAAALAAQSGPEHLRPAVAVAAWRSGAVRWRAAALTTAGSLPDPVLAGAVGLLGTGGGADPWQPPPPADADPRAVLAGNAEDPWWWPGQPGPWRIGGFRGFGGPWIRIPQLLGGDGLRWWVRTEAADGDGAPAAGGYRYWEVRADVHGSLAVPRPAPPDGDRPAWAAGTPSGAMSRVVVRAHERSYYLHVQRR